MRRAWVHTRCGASAYTIATRPYTVSMVMVIAIGMARSAARQRPNAWGETPRIHSDPGGSEVPGFASNQLS